MGNWDLRLSLSLQSLSESFSIMLLKRSTLSWLSYVQLFATLWTVAQKAPQSMRVSRQEYWSGLSCPPPGDLSDPGIKPGSPVLQVDSLPLNHQDARRDPTNERAHYILGNSRSFLLAGWLGSSFPSCLQVFSKDQNTMGLSPANESLKT